MFSSVKVFATLALALRAALANPSNHDHDHQLDKRYTERTQNLHKCFSITTEKIDPISYVNSGNPSIAPTTFDSFYLSGEFVVNLKPPAPL